MSNKSKINEEPRPQDLMVGETLFGELLNKAVDKLDGEGAESVVGVIERLVDLKMKVDQREAEKEFNQALAEFQDECPPIPKSSTAKVTTKSGSKYSYNYAELDEIAKTVKPFLFHRGLSFTWDSESVNGTVKCTCYLRHRNGHKITSTFQAPVPDSLGSMNPIQINAAVLTYVKRQSLVEILGLTTTENDTDGVSPETITKDQAADLEAKIEELKSDKGKFLELMGVKDFQDIRAADLKRAVGILKQKEKKIAGGELI